MLALQVKKGPGIEECEHLLEAGKGKRVECPVLSTRKAALLNLKPRRFVLDF